MTYWKPNQFGDQADVNQNNISGTEGTTLGNIIVGVNQNDETELVRLQDGDLTVTDRRLLAMMAQILNELQTMNHHLACITGEDE